MSRQQRHPDVMASVKVAAGQGQGCVALLASLVEWGILVGTVYIIAQVDRAACN